MPTADVYQLVQLLLDHGLKVRDMRRLVLEEKESRECSRLM